MGAIRWASEFDFRADEPTYVKIMAVCRKRRFAVKSLCGGDSLSERVCVSRRRTDVCQNGRSMVITLRCDPTDNGNGTLLLPPMCSDGTCDGCNFHMVWLSQHACPRCIAADYHEFREECKKGQQVIQYQGPKWVAKESGALQEKKKKIVVPTVIFNNNWVQYTENKIQTNKNEMVQTSFNIAHPASENNWMQMTACSYLLGYFWWVNISLVMKIADTKLLTYLLHNPDFMHFMGYRFMETADNSCKLVLS